MKLNIKIKQVVILVLISYLVCFAQQQKIRRTELLEMEISQQQYDELQAMKISFVTGLVNGKAMAVISKAEEALLAERGYNFKKILHSENELDLYRRALFGKSIRLAPIYHTYEEVREELRQLQREFHDLTKLVVIGETSQLKRPIYAFKISDNAKEEEEEPSILFSGAIHSDELAGTEICMRLIHYLLENYGKSSEVRKWIDRNEIWFVPIINVDGHETVTSGKDPRWRKNLRDNNQNNVLYEKADGVDLNRNFDFNWAHGGSGDPENERYRGELPFSESECVAMKDFVQQQRFVLSVTYHSQGEVVYYPWIWRGRKAPDDKLLTKMANELASRIKSCYGDSSYKAFYGAGTVGQTYPYYYGAVGTFDFIVETGKGRHIFPADELNCIIEANLPGAFYMLDQLDGPGLKIKTVSQSGKPISATVWFPDIETEDVRRRCSDAQNGVLFRKLLPGKYRLMVMKEGYNTVLMKNVEVFETGWTEVDVEMIEK